MASAGRLDPWPLLHMFECSIVAVVSLCTMPDACLMHGLKYMVKGLMHVLRYMVKGQSA